MSLLPFRFQKFKIFILIVSMINRYCISIIIILLTVLLPLSLRSLLRFLNSAQKDSSILTFFVGLFDMHYFFFTDESNITYTLLFI